MKLPKNRSPKMTLRKMLSVSKYLTFFGRFFAPYTLVILFQPSLVAACDFISAEKLLVIGDFSNGVLRNWQETKFSGHTEYDLTNIDGVSVLRARSRRAASGLIIKQKVDLYSTPVLNWRWRIDQPLANDRERERSGDDFAARLYVVAKDGILFWNTRALNYVWASNEPAGQLWPNPFAGEHAMMLALRSGDTPPGSWVIEKRNVFEDLMRVFGRKIRYIDAVAVMTDTDNAQATALSYYGDICFSAD